QSLSVYLSTWPLPHSGIELCKIISRGEMPLHTEELTRFLSKIEPFNLLSEDVCREIARSSSLKKFSAKETIFFEGSTGESGCIVYSGRVAMVKSSGSGREMIVEL